MELPHDIEERLERRWFARHIQEMEIRQQKKIVNETEVIGPDGNYLPTYCNIFNERHKTPWGAAVNFDATGSDVMREFIV